MSGYNSGRRAPTFSQYLNDLNAIPSPYDLAQQQAERQDLFNVDAELALFTNAEFLDFDAVGDLSVDLPVKFERVEGTDAHNKDSPSTVGDGDNNVKYLDMLNDFNLASYPPDFQSPIITMQAPAYPLSQLPPPSHNGAPMTSGEFGHSISPQPVSARSSSNVSLASPLSQPAKRKQEAMSPGNPSMDEAARLAQEEDKRRRNTAASARFRIKKKEREKNMERTVKEVTAKNATLEARITQLEMENRWLKNLITEKNSGAIADGDIAGMFDKYRASAEVAQQQPSNGLERRKACLTVGAKIPAFFGLPLRSLSCLRVRRDVESDSYPKYELTVLSSLHPLGMIEEGTLRLRYIGEEKKSGFVVEVFEGMFEVTWIKAGEKSGC
ncbi:uncharacterized protein PADG_04540 [Paracoccidioides brasiliensis Pb18]|uniref:BZIP domain-containing protein n=1 Tax=Paracoccidioides brasiliensis (strain Pb18) TaxID=502780 RepID=C1GC18_PARBD|nr:uncharacterized protein PADG_04540 [Paracoccidioides brasiliensis Pb18]EEH48461.2 hypothetical protein PADG_04540 [Paracoccidioides brasiliensis Pb18]